MLFSFPKKCEVQKIPVKKTKLWGGWQKNKIVWFFLSLQSSFDIITSSCITCLMIILHQNTVTEQNDQIQSTSTDFFDIVTVWHDSSTQYFEHFQEVKFRKISVLPSALPIWPLYCTWRGIRIIIYGIWPIEGETPQMSQCDRYACHFFWYQIF